MKKTSVWNVHFAGHQRVKWAWDEDLRWAETALADRITHRSALRSRIIHAVWWPSAWVLGPALLRRRMVVCFADNPASYYARHPLFYAAARHVDHWIARSQGVADEFRALGFSVSHAPYCADSKIFRRLAGNGVRNAWRERLGLAADAFVVANFNRDTEWTGAGPRPKRQKAPELFLEIVKRVAPQHPKFVVLLAGPRRHWLRTELERNGIPFRFVGEVTAGDDYTTNILSRETLNELYHASDLYLLTSRWEGGPHAVLEAALAGCPVLSTPVGIAADLLQAPSLFTTVDEGVAKLEQQIRNPVCSGSASHDEQMAASAFSFDVLQKKLLDAYATFPTAPPVPWPEAFRDGLANRLSRVRVRTRPGQSRINLGTGIGPGPLAERLRRIFPVSDNSHSQMRIESISAWNELAPAHGTNMLLLEDEDIERNPETMRRALAARPNGVIVPHFDTIHKAAARKMTLPRPLVVPIAADWDSIAADIPITAQVAAPDEDVKANIEDYFRATTQPDAMAWEGLR